MQSRDSEMRYIQMEVQIKRSYKWLGMGGAWMVPRVGDGAANGRGDVVQP